MRKRYDIPTVEVTVLLTTQLMGLDSISNDPDPGYSPAPRRRGDFTPAF